MSVKIIYSCGGCDAVAEARAERRTIVDRPRAFVVDGVAFDRCRVETDTIESVCPEGWVAFDPYTHCCYCPECWASIESRVPAEVSS